MCTKLWKSMFFYTMHQGVEMTLKYSLYCQEIQKNGHKIVQIPLPNEWRKWREQNDYMALDQAVAKELEKGGLLYQQLEPIGNFQQVEHILALRCSTEDEEGIWHDDGSRNFAFSLGLNLAPQNIRGGMLSFRRKDATQSQEFPPLAWGQMIIFLTGVWGYEHQVSQVTFGQRLVAAGWCS